MTERVLLQKATRIEGNASVQIEVTGTRVSAARFMVQDFRGFEAFLRGRRIETVPQLVSRVCGLCSASHQVAGLSAIEDALGAQVPPSALALREIAVLAEWIASHAASYFFLAMPDLANVEGGLFELMRDHTDLTEEALELRRRGQTIVRLLGGRSTHPVSFCVGGFAAEVSDEDVESIRDAAENALAQALSLASRACNAREESAFPFPVDQQVNLLTYDKNDELFHATDESGKTVVQFDRRAFASSIAEMRADWSFAKFPYLADLGFPAGIMAVGPLARCRRTDGPLHDPLFSENDLGRRLREQKSLSLSSNDACRLLEIAWAAQRILQLLTTVDTLELRTTVDARISGSGIGVVEAPRGLLVHSYELEDGLLSRIRLLVATQFNNALINMLLKDIAQEHVDDGSISAEGERRIGRCIRLFDPCLTCATH